MPENCIFCDRSQFEERLVHEYADFYVIATLGQITDGGYVLLVPKKHISCMGALDTGQTLDALAITKQTCRALTHEYKLKQVRDTLWPITLFEHGVVGQTVQHAHLHFIPATIDITGRIRNDFPVAEIDELEFAGELWHSYKERPEPYLYWTRPDGKAMVCWNPPAPKQYLRSITAELLGRSERANWRMMDPKLDRELWSETVQRLKPCFP